MPLLLVKLPVPGELDDREDYFGKAAWNHKSAMLVLRRHILRMC